MLLAELASTSREVAATGARSVKAERLAALLRRLEGDEIEIGVAWLSGHPRQSRLGIGGATVHGVRGSEAAAAPSLTLADADTALARIAALAGAGSGGERQRSLAALFARATAEEQDFLARLIVGELRQGALAGVMEDALAKATGIPAAEIRRATMLSGDAEAVARAVLHEGRAALARFQVELFRPVQPMLASPADDLDAALERLGEAALEYKLDGARVQLHKSGEEVRVFSRRMNDVTVAVPELVEAARALPAREMILDGEAIALREDGRPHPFQATMRRFGRRLDVEALRGELPLTPFFFDLLRLDGADFFDVPARDRFEALARVAPALVVPRRVTGDVDAAEAFLREALARGHEGLMAKAPEARYEAGRRGFSWLKVKEAHTLDLVVLAAEWGHGRRKGFLSNIHLGARDAASGGFVMLGKTFKGMTDAMLAWQTQRFQELAVATDGYTVQLRPELVVEVAFNDVQESPHYPAGLALRFARVKRYRPDKAAAQADTLETVRAIHEGRLSS
ncbi:MAG TPA: ATP-dependent DNA ligase [Candidatus Eisenbacteria bacterium]|nr:ATP-dependent DNA ligase [Candidatus Eisenbacteria bacterium]